ncbi:hypothetical protein [Photorhabdus bodei]|uniref:Uncharacterized protein n=1 Tax=Photorhabdus bodei TaxID=2029681 RepID=A0AAW6BPS3_9GAMM|nr:hypothetical protein [Photorhabdus bodei]MDB6373860.1 hypothetical protein [Photorhabdus bodei]
MIIAKLSFSVPTDLVSQTLTEWMNKAGGDTFYEITVPNADSGRRATYPY